MLTEVQVYQIVTLACVVASGLWIISLSSHLSAERHKCDDLMYERNRLRNERDDWQRRADRSEERLIDQLTSMDGYQEEANWWRDRFIEHVDGKKPAASEGEDAEEK